ncbi:MAG: hypothetical protein AABZ39_15465 [Spirochaetota bacterium]
MNTILKGIAASLIAVCTVFSQAPVADDFETLDKKVWSWKDNVKLSPTASGDPERKTVLKIESDFSKFTYAWFGRAFVAGDVSPEKASGVKFFIKSEGEQFFTATLHYMDGSTQIKYDASITLTASWSEAVIPFTSFKKAEKSMTDDELKRVTGIMLVAGKKNADKATLYFDDFSLVQK